MTFGEITLHCLTIIRARRPTWTRPLLALVALLTGCVVEQIDAIIADRGVTEWSESSEGSGGSDTSTTVSTDTGTDASTSGSASSGSGAASVSESTAGGGSESSSTTTGPALPVCGDGIVEGDEACDDGNEAPGDGCQECAKDSIVFISSEVYQGFAIGGLYGADQRCRGLAAKAKLPDFLTFKHGSVPPPFPPPTDCCTRRADMCW